MKTVGHWNAGLDDVVKIGWPWHGALQQVSPTMYTLTTPTGEVINLPAGDLSHAISYPVSLTGAASWRTGKCQRYQIPGLPPAVTTPAERAEGMTWLNYFVQSGIADILPGYSKLVDESGKAWHCKIIWSAVSTPVTIEIWHVVNGAMVKRSQISVTPPAAPFVNTFVIVARRGVTVSSTGRLMAVNVFDIDDPVPKRVFSVTITGSVLDNTLAAEITKLVDADISGMTGTTGNALTHWFSGTWTNQGKWILYKAPVDPEGNAVWGAGVLVPGENFTSDSGSYGPVPSSYNTNAFPGHVAPAGWVDGDYAYGWFTSGILTFTLNETSINNYGSFKCIGFFIGHDDTLVRVDSVYSREMNGVSESTHAGVTSSSLITTHSDFVRVGSRESARVSTSGSLINGVETPAGQRGQVVNLLSEGHRAVAIATPVASGFSAYAYICGQVQDAAVYPTVFSSANAFPAPPNFSIHPVTGAILTRPNDGYPVSWV